jgi:hypothetical protein
VIDRSFSANTGQKQVSDKESSAKTWVRERGVARRAEFHETQCARGRRASTTSWEKGVRDFLGTFGFVRSDMPDWRTAPLEEAGPLAQELGWRAIVHGRVDAIAASSIDSWFWVRLNGVSVLLPRYTLMVMRACLTASDTALQFQRVFVAD